MQTNNHKIIDYDAVLDAKFGKEGTSSRIDAEEKAFAFYTEQKKSTFYRIASALGLSGELNTA
jgi:hypothetical protein